MIKTNYFYLLHVYLSFKLAHLYSISFYIKNDFTVVYLLVHSLGYDFIYEQNNSISIL